MLAKHNHAISCNVNIIDHNLIVSEWFGSVQYCTRWIYLRLLLVFCAYWVYLTKTTSCFAPDATVTTAVRQKCRIIVSNWDVEGPLLQSGDAKEK